MAMPRKLKNMNTFHDGINFVGVTKSITLPVLARKMESYRGGGMNGPVKADLGFSDDGLQCEWKIGGIDDLVFKQFGNASASGLMIRFAGSYQRDDSIQVSAVEVVIRGRHETIDMGEATPGEDTEHTITTTCSYYKLTMDGVVLVEIDLLNFVEIVNGVDMLAAQRRAIGL